jgi:hypothetical protein
MKTIIEFIVKYFKIWLLYFNRIRSELILQINFRNFEIRETIKFIEILITLITHKIILFIFLFKTYLIEKNKSIILFLLKLEEKIICAFKIIENYSIILMKIVRSNLELIMTCLTIYVMFELIFLIVISGL